jgi:hypothetical protein
MRKMLPLLIGLAICILAAVGTLILKNRPIQGVEAEPAIQILRADPARLKRIEVASGNSKTALYKDESGWKLDYPYPVRLWEVSVHNLVYTFTRLDAARLVSEGSVNKSEYGLDPPIAVAMASFDDGTQKTLHLGNKSPSDSTYFLMVEGEDKLYTVSKNIASYLQYVLSDFRIRTVNPIRLERIEYLRVRRGSLIMETRLKQGNELSRFSLTYGNYLMSKPYKILRGLSSEKFPGLLLKLDDLRIDEFVSDAPESLSKYGLDTPWGEVFGNDDTAKLHLFFGSRNETGKVYFRIAGDSAIYAMEESRVEFLRSFKPFEFVDKYVFIPELKDVAKINIQFQGKWHELGISRAVMQGPTGGEAPEILEKYSMDGKELDPERFKKIFLDIAGLYAEGDVSGTIRGKPEVTIAFELLTGEKVRVDYMPYDRNFLAILKDGVSELAISREQVGRMLSSLVRD